MSTLPDPDPRQTDRSSQVGQAEPTINEPAVQELRSWNEAKLLEWIQQKLSVPLKPGNEEKFLNAEIDGGVFLNHGGDWEFFMRVGFSHGVSDKLSELARNNISKKSKYCIMDVTSADNVTGDAGDAGMSDP